MLAALRTILGLDSEPKDLTSLQVSLRALIVFVVTIWVVRIGDKRFLAQKTAYDAVLSLILASMLSRAINGSAGFIPTLAGGFVLVLAHRGLAYCAARSHWFGSLIKGHDTKLIENGVVRREALLDHHISEHDLAEDLRLHGIDNPKEIKEARLERSGDISVVKND